MVMAAVMVFVVMMAEVSMQLSLCCGDIFYNVQNATNCKCNIISGNNCLNAFFSILLLRNSVIKLFLKAYMALLNKERLVLENVRYLGQKQIYSNLQKLKPSSMFICLI
jgi:hypothetical protein